LSYQLVSFFRFFQIRNSWNSCYLASTVELGGFDEFWAVYIGHTFVAGEIYRLFTDKSFYYNVLSPVFAEYIAGIVISLML
jgi:hypothetical protein